MDFSPPFGGDEGPRGVQAAVHVQCADHRLAGVRQHRGVLVVGPLARRHLDVVREAKAQGDAPADRRARQRGQARRERALFFVREFTQQGLGNHQAQDPVAEEFQALVGGCAGTRRAAQGAAMCECFKQDFRVLERVTQRLFERMARVQLMPLKKRENLIANGHFQGWRIEALPSVEKNRNSARPTRFSAGTKPTSARLSEE